MKYYLSQAMVWLGFKLIGLAPWAIPKGRRVGYICGLSDQTMDRAYLTVAQCERVVGSVTGEHKRHNALRALLNVGEKERDAALAIELAVRSVL